MVAAWVAFDLPLGPGVGVHYEPPAPAVAAQESCGGRPGRPAQPAPGGRSSHRPQPRRAEAACFSEKVA